jgi:predicted dehydrogenase
MINWGIVGLGNMANNFAKSIDDVENAKIVSLASRSNNKLDIFSKNYGINTQNKFLKYEDLLQSKEVEAVYISTLNNTHVNLIVNSAKNKKKILCEKPIGLDLDEANLAYESIKRYGASFYEAIAYRSHPQTLNVLQLVNSGEIGDVYKIESSFGFNVKRIKKDSRLFSKKLGGGAILDIGCYPISFFNLFCKKEEKLKFIKSQGSFTSTGVDDRAEINISIGNNIEGIGKVSLKENLKNSCKIYGKEGIINIPSPWLPLEKSYVEIIKGNSYFKKFTTTSKKIYSIQIENISNAFLNKNSHINQLVDINESLEIMKVLDKWKKNLI